MPHPFSGQIPRRWLPVLRGAWVVCALLLLANFVASIPGYYHLMSTVCPLPDQAECTSNYRAAGGDHGREPDEPASLPERLRGLFCSAERGGIATTLGDRPSTLRSQVRRVDRLARLTAVCVLRG